MQKGNIERLKQWSFIFLFIAATAAAIFLSAKIRPYPVMELFAFQTDAFIHGHLDIPAKVILTHGGNFVDLVFRDGKYYLPHPPLPSVLLLPYVAAFGPVNAQSALQYVLVPIAAFFAYLLFNKRGLDRSTSGWLTFTLLFSSVFFGVIILINYCYVSQVLAVALAFAALYEFSGRDRPWLIGILVAAMCATRSTAGLAMIIFFTLETALRPIRWRERLKRLVVMAIPIVAVALALAYFNAARFGNPMDFGYRDSILVIQPEHDMRETYGIFNPIYIPRNLYYSFSPFTMVDNGQWGMDGRGISFFLVCPVFLCLFALRRWNRTVIATLVASGVVLGIFLCYYATGFFQLGPRYFCDFLPLLFLLLIELFKKIKLNALIKGVILGGAAINLVFAASWLR